MPEILVTEFMDAGALDALRVDHDVHYDPSLVDKADVLADLAQGARALIVRNRTQVRAGLLANAPNLIVVGRLGVGLDNIDVDDCRARDIQVYPATGANDVAVAEYVICGVMMLLRGAYHASGEVAAGAWPRTRLMGREVSGKRLGLIGFGAIARETAQRARALGMEVVAFDPFVAADDPAWRAHGVGPRSLDDLLTESDAVSLHVPLTSQTRNLIDAAALDRMKPGAVLINAARGGVVDEAALAAALRRGAIGGAMLDVFEAEPLGAGSALCDVPNLILTPHIAGVTEESNVRVSALIASKVSQALKGRS
ncbi:MAG TPA: hydroxyacid dehydrogenase [Xanthobacteraceae bacterium]|jgi:(S)-sulfolactate dehydrogenase|nr:MAG: 3-phosphoglycerate dehydrogenase [Rhizobiales bacterium 12-66-7]OYY83583.1 MAG: 3-phosphoglycerate dehydrogenase [Rhizobiales bacterium 35-66-30]OZA98552.1 MAG: 3-phosphoglycerate dehydrogenase [Rhizobiales bacterium 39-66-18]HQS09693.1 hydroxyacid dehydrogenase [Xanthobacteraceae bacterium]